MVVNVFMLPVLQLTAVKAMLAAHVLLGRGNDNEFTCSAAVYGK